MDRVTFSISSFAILGVLLALVGTGGLPSDNRQGLSWTNQITVEKNGDKVDTIYNELTDQGKVYIAGKLFGNASSNANFTAKNFTYISVGDGSTVAAGDTRLDDEYTNYNLSRSQAASVTSSAIGTYTLQKQFVVDLSSGPSELTVNTTGLNYDSSGDTLISGGNFTEATLTDGDKLTVSHEVTISGSGS